MNTPHYSVLIAVIHDEDLFRLRYRLRKELKKHGPNPEIELWIDVLTKELALREEGHLARA